VFSDDAAFRASSEEVELTRQHEHFIQDYYERTGMIWRTHFDENGPRPPPLLFMWEANEVGQTHGVTSHNGHWYVINPNWHRLSY
jgi:hypothetical protein